MTTPTIAPTATTAPMTLRTMMRVRLGSRALRGPLGPPVRTFGACTVRGGAGTWLFFFFAISDPRYQALARVRAP
jgi:hypothetical protein